ncbi:hypothetical protein KKF61_08070, partial [Patescibacteria group bacterium]|nr:hypothetical protein [Patescibacteria group bacterium]
MTQHLQTQIFHELSRELSQVRKRKRRPDGDTEQQAVFERYRVTHGVRPNTFRKWWRSQQGTRRADAGKFRKAEQWRPVIEAVFRIQCEMSDFEAGRWIAAEYAVREAKIRNEKLEI